MRGAATFLASPRGGGSNAARKAKRVVALLPHNTTHTHLPGEHGDLGSPLGRRAALVWAGLACRARGDKEKAKR